MKNFAVTINVNDEFRAYVRGSYVTYVFQLRQLRPFTRSLTTEAAKTLVQAFISCRLDYCNSLLYGVTDNVMRRVQSRQNAAVRLITGARRRDHITPVLCQLYTGFLFGGEWSSNSPVWCAKHCAVKCLSAWLIMLMTFISSPKATDDLFGLPLITCARYHVRPTALETEALALSAHEFGTVCRAAYGHLTSAMNILKRWWRHICFDKATALCDILYKRFENILTYILTYLLTTHSSQSRKKQLCWHINVL